MGLYSNLNDTAFQHEPMMRIARTDGNGHFVIKGVAKGDYRIYALQDMDGNYKFNQPGEKIAFTPEIIMPSFKPDVRQDTIWRDSLHISDIKQVPYTHFFARRCGAFCLYSNTNQPIFLKSRTQRTQPFHLVL